MEVMKIKRINITQPADLLAEIDRKAAECGLSRSEWMAEAAIQCMDNAAISRLAERPKAGRPRKALRK